MATSHSLPDHVHHGTSKPVPDPSIAISTIPQTGLQEDGSCHWASLGTLAVHTATTSNSSGQTSPASHNSSTGKPSKRPPQPRNASNLLPSDATVYVVFNHATLRPSDYVTNFVFHVFPLFNARFQCLVVVFSVNIHENRRNPVCYAVFGHLHRMK